MSVETKESNKIVEAGLQLAEQWSNMPKGKVPFYESYPEEHINFLEGIEDPYKRSLIATLLENSRKLYETTTSDNIGTFPKYVFPLIKATYMNIVTGELFSVQPITGPTGLVFYFDVVYGSTKGNVAAGSTMFSSTGGPQTGNEDYSSDKINVEQIGVGTGAVAHYTANLSWIAVRPSSVTITTGTHTVTDDGNGHLIGDVNGGGVNTINYVTGAIDVTFSSNVPGAAPIVVDYNYNMEMSDQTPEVDIVLSSSPVVAQPKHLKAKWSHDAEQDLMALHGINAETEIVAFLSNEVQKEIYNSMIRQARTVAPGGYIDWNSAVPLAVPEVIHRQSIVPRFTSANNAIFERTQRFGANWMVCGPQYASYVEALPDQYFTREKSLAGAGVHKIGTLSTGQVVYKDPSYPTAEAIMGHKGTSFMEAGIIHAVYIGLYTTDTIRLDDFRVRKGLATRSTIKVTNSKFYQKLRIV